MAVEKTVLIDRLRKIEDYYLIQDFPLEILFDEPAWSFGFVKRKEEFGVKRDVPTNVIKLRILSSIFI